MKKTTLLLGICCAVLAGCGDNDNALEYTNDFENSIGWIDNCSNVKTVVKGIARSGNYMSVTDTSNRYGYLFRAKLSDLTENKIKTIKTSAWVSMPVINDKAVLVIIVDSLDKTIVWEGKKLAEAIKEPNKWTEVINSADLSKLKPSKDYLLSIYIWNTGETVIYSDDHRVKLYE